MQVFDFIEGSTPLLISMPHCGTALPPALANAYSDIALQLADTDWHLPQLYGFAAGLGASLLQARVSRYVIDLNRPPDNAELYPGAYGTALCPIYDFAEQALYKADCEPGEAEIDSRLETYWRPYHQKLQQIMQQLKNKHGIAVLLEAHSIRSLVPSLFTGRLPDFNIGTAEGRSCAPAMQAAVSNFLEQQNRYGYVVNQRFRGGYITRTYGQPREGIHALQLELSQRTYMDEEYPFHYREELAVQVQPLLQGLVTALIGWGNSAL